MPSPANRFEWALSDSTLIVGIQVQVGTLDELQSPQGIAEDLQVAF